MFVVKARIPLDVTEKQLIEITLDPKLVMGHRWCLALLHPAFALNYPSVSQVKRGTIKNKFGTIGYNATSFILIISSLKREFSGTSSSCPTAKNTKKKCGRNFNTLLKCLILVLLEFGWPEYFLRCRQFNLRKLIQYKCRRRFIIIVLRKIFGTEYH